MHRATYQPPAVPAVRYRIRWDRIVGAFAVGAVAGTLIAAAWSVIPDTPPRTGPDTTGGIGICSPAYSADCAAYYADTVPASATAPAPASAPAPAPAVPASEAPDEGGAPAAPVPAPAASEPAPSEVRTGPTVDDEPSEVRTDDTVTEPIVNEPAPLDGNGTLDDGEIADGPVTEYDEAILVCGTGATVAIDTDIHGNAWAYCEPR